MLTDPRVCCKRTRGLRRVNRQAFPDVLSSGPTDPSPRTPVSGAQWGMKQEVPVGTTTPRMTQQGLQSDPSLARPRAVIARVAQARSALEGIPLSLDPTLNVADGPKSNLRNFPRIDSGVQLLCNGCPLHRLASVGRSVFGLLDHSQQAYKNWTKAVFGILGRLLALNVAQKFLECPRSFRLLDEVREPRGHVPQHIFYAGKV